MGFPKVLIASFFLMSVLLLLNVQAIQTNHQLTSKGVQTPKIDCKSLCGVRCSLSSRPNLCKRACGTCCSRCGCVPPGTSGNYGACSCYAKLTTHGNRRKCP